MEYKKVILIHHKCLQFLHLYCLPILFDASPTISTDITLLAVDILSTFVELQIGHFILESVLTIL